MIALAAEAPKTPGRPRVTVFQLNGAESSAPTIRRPSLLLPDSAKRAITEVADFRGDFINELLQGWIIEGYKNGYDPAKWRKIPKKYRGFGQWKPSVYLDENLMVAIRELALDKDVSAAHLMRFWVLSGLVSALARN